MKMALRVAGSWYVGGAMLGLLTACAPAGKVPQLAGAAPLCALDFVITAAGPQEPHPAPPSSIWSRLDDVDTIAVTLSCEDRDSLLSIGAVLERVRMAWPDGPVADSLDPTLTPSQRWVRAELDMPGPIALNPGTTTILEFAPRRLMVTGRDGDSLFVVGVRFTAVLAGAGRITRVLELLGPDY
jgi:hypothetical protein